MKVLLTRPSTHSSLPWYFPSGLGYVAGSLADAGHEVSVLDAEVEGWDLTDHCRRLAAADYDVLGISALINRYGYVRGLAEASRNAHPGARIVVGGNITGPVWRLLLQITEADVLVIGEGEVTILEVLRCFDEGTPLGDVDGIAFRREHEPFQTRPRTPVENLDAISFPAYDLFPMEAYLSTPGKLARKRLCSRDLSMITARGCPFHCTFCFRPPWERVRFRTWGNVMAELRFLMDNYGVDGVTFNDELTLVSKERSRALCDTIEKTGIVWGCVGRVNTVDLPLLRRLREAGCRWMTYGIESGSQLILDEMKKGVRVEAAKKAVLWTKQAGIATNPTFMLGYPSETRETAMASVRFMKETGLHPDSLFFATPYPGTELFENAVAAGQIPWGLEEYLFAIDGKDAHELLVNLTAMTDAELLGLKNEILATVAPENSRGAQPWLRRASRVLREEGAGALARRCVSKLGGCVKRCLRSTSR